KLSDFLRRQNKLKNNIVERFNILDSKCHYLSMGIPQGSILGPTLFKINVINKSNNNIVHAVDILSSLQHNFNCLQHAFSNLYFHLNTSKTKFMIFNRNLPQSTFRPSTVSLDGTEIQLISIWVSGLTHFHLTFTLIHYFVK
uniref:Reverse transcriptase domain-containing protein n=1 Tax=Nothobranchius furzeri TaxID=105023 RepID=A0A8C6KWU0_NOTFU